MKYIKSFEGRKSNPIRKYIVLKDYLNNDDNVLLVFMKTKPKMMWIKYVFYIDSDELGESDKFQTVKQEYDEDIINKNLVFTSDDLLTVIKHLQFISTTSKYNI